jgi:opacity protein-like surface antigen
VQAGLEGYGAEVRRCPPTQGENIMKRILKMTAISLVVIACAAAPAMDADAQSYTTIPSEGRAGTWEFLLPLLYVDSGTIEGQGGSSVDIDGDVGIGIGAGYNFTEYFQLNGLFTWTALDYTANVINSDFSVRPYSNTLYNSTISLNGIVYFLKGKINPFVSGGVGVTYVDTNIQTGPGSTACWWDPWYGYMCTGTAPTKTETDMSYNAGVGVRFDLTPQFSLQPSYNKMWIDMDKTSSTPDFDIWRLDLIFRM